MLCANCPSSTCELHFVLSVENVAVIIVEKEPFSFLMEKSLAAYLGVEGGDDGQVSWAARMRTLLCIGKNSENILAVPPSGQLFLIHEVWVKYTALSLLALFLHHSAPSFRRNQILIHTEMGLGMRPEGREDRTPLPHCGSRLSVPVGLHSGCLRGPAHRP